MVYAFTLDESHGNVQYCQGKKCVPIGQHEKVAPPRCIRLNSGLFILQNFQEWQGLKSRPNLLN